MGLLDDLLKIAEVKTPLLPHQQRVVDRIQKEDQPGLLVVHGLGSGKTLSSIAAQDALGVPSTVVVPAALRDNYAKERAKHLKGHKQPAHIESIQNLAAKGTTEENPLMIVDEAHRARDIGSATFRAIKNLGAQADKRLLLTGSPFYNHPADIAPLINLAANAKILPHDRKDFESAYITEKVVKPSFWDKHINQATPGTIQVLYDRKAPELKQKFSKWVDYHPGTKDNFPDVETKQVQVELTPDQLKLYDTLMGQAPPWVAAKVKRGLPPSKQESAMMNNFLGSARQAVNTTAGLSKEDAVIHQPKIDKAFETLKKMIDENPRAKALVYSNWLESGINPYKAKLQEAGVPFGEFTGDIAHSKRDQMVRDYNEGKLRALLVSSAGGEGLDLKGTRLVQILDPHWNREKLKQLEGRAARYGSHADLPPEERKVLIEHYLGVRPKGLITRFNEKWLKRTPDKAVDEYLSDMSQKKEDLIKQFRDLLPQHEKTASDKVHKKTEFQGIPVHIDRPKGFLQKFDGKNGLPAWTRKYKTDYGFIPGTKDKDGEETDVYLGPNKNADKAFIIKQMLNGKFDENKVMLGFNSEGEARKMFLAHSSPAYKDTIIGRIDSVPMDDFKKSIGFLKTAGSANFKMTDEGKNELAANKLRLQLASAGRVGFSAINPVVGMFSGALLPNLLNRNVDERTVRSSLFVPTATSLLAGAGAGALGGLMAESYAPSLIKNLAVEANKSPAKANALEEVARRSLLGQTVEDLRENAPKAGLSALMTVPAYVRGFENPKTRGLATLLAGTQIAGLLGKSVSNAVWDRDISRMALSQLDAAKKWKEDSDISKLRRLRKQVSKLEESVEGDGWSAPQKKDDWLCRYIRIPTYMPARTKYEMKMMRADIFCVKIQTT